MKAVWIAASSIMLLLVGTLIASRCNAQASAGKAATWNAAGNVSFEELVDQDVANGYYSQAQGEALKAQYAAAEEQFETASERLDANVNQSASLLNGSDLNNQVSAVVQNGQLSLGGTPEQINEQALGVYNAVDKALQLTISVYDALQPAMQVVLDGLNSVMAARAAAILANPNLTSAQKFYIQQEANKLNLAATYSVQQWFNTQTAQLNTALANFENNKQQFVQQASTVIQVNSTKYGSNPAQWPANPPPAPAPAPQTTAAPTRSTATFSNLEIISVGPSATQSPDSAPTPTVAPQANNQLPNGANSTANTNVANTAAVSQSAQTPGMDPAISANPNINTSTSNSSQSTPSATGSPADPAFNAYRNYPGGVAPANSGAAASSSIGAGAGSTLGYQAGIDPSAQPYGPTQLPLWPFPSTAVPGPYGPDVEPNGMFYPTAPGNGANSQPNSLVEGDSSIGEGFSGVANLINGIGFDLPGFSAGSVQSIEFGDQVSVAALAPIYAGYKLTDNTGDAMTSLNLQVQTPAQMQIPSMQITGMPSDVMTSLDLQPALCGR